MKNLSSTQISKQARTLEEALKEMAGKLPIGLDAAAVTAAIGKLDQAKAEIQRIDVQRLVAANKRDEEVVAVNDLLKRVRSQVKASFGDDSTEYEMAGGKRRSDRKRPVRTARPRATPPASPVE